MNFLDVVKNIPKWFMGLNTAGKVMTIADTVVVLGLVGGGVTYGVVNGHKVPEPEVEETIVVDEEANMVTLSSVYITTDSLEKDLNVYFSDANGERITGKNWKAKLVKFADTDEGNPFEIAAKTQKFDANLWGVDGIVADGALGANTADGNSSSENASGDNADSDEDKVVEATETVALANEYSVDTATYEDAMEKYRNAYDAMEGEIIVDDDADGMIYLKNLDGGYYQVWFDPEDGDYFPQAPVYPSEVKSKVEYEVVKNIEKKVEAYVAAEDVNSHNVVQEEETVLKDTVEFVESSSKKDTDVYAPAKAVAPGSAVTPTAGTATTIKDATTGIDVASATPSASLGVGQKLGSISIEKTDKVTGITPVTTSLKVDNPSVATAALSGNSIQVNGVSAGKAKITVTVNYTYKKAETNSGSQTGSGESGTSTGEGQTGSGESGSSAGDQSESGGSGTSTGEGQTGSGESGTPTGDGQSGSGESVTPTGDGQKDSGNTPVARLHNTKFFVVGATDEKTGSITWTIIVEVIANDASTQLKDAAGHPLFKDANGTIKATAADYDPNATYYYLAQEGKTTYYGWQTLNGNTYYYDKNGNPVTGTQVILGMQYTFGTDGALLSGMGAGIDVSKWNGNIDWGKVKSSGITFAIVRCGGRYRNDRTLYKDPNYAANMKGATSAGIKTGVYFYSTALSVGEAVEEASLAVSMARGYKVSLPIFIDMEDSVQAGLSTEQRTAIAQAFCETVRSAGYTPGVYANYTWWTTKLNAGALSRYRVWIARYNTTLGYSGKYDIWQYSSKGKINGINGNVDVNKANY